MKKDSIAWIGILTLLLITISLLTVFKTTSRHHSSTQNTQVNPSSQPGNFLFPDKNETSTQSGSFLLRDVKNTSIQAGNFITYNNSDTTSQPGNFHINNKNDTSSQPVNVSQAKNESLSNRPQLHYHNTTENRTSFDQLNNTGLAEQNYSEQGNDASTTTHISGELHIVYFGNSMIFKNDCPGMIEKMIVESTSDAGGIPANVTQDTCLVGGATLT